MPPMTPTSLHFVLHQTVLDIIRRRAVYHWPPEPAEVIQGHLQTRIAEMRRDGYEPEYISSTLCRLAELTISEAEQFLCNVSRAHFFAELVRLEIEQ